MKSVAANLPVWIAGTAVALLGVALARVVAPSLAGDAQVYLAVGGQLLAVGGLLIICLGIRRRIKLPVSEGAADDSPSNPPN